MELFGVLAGLFCVFAGYMYIKQSNEKKLGVKTKRVASLFGEKFALIYKKIIGYILLIFGIFITIYSLFYTKIT